MRIVIAAPLPDPSRWSMNLYAERLAEFLKPVLSSDDSVEVFPSPSDFPKRSTGKLQRYCDQYWIYGRKLRRKNADIYHIVDHGYANLIPFLDRSKVVQTFHDALLLNLHERKLPVEWSPVTSILAQRYSFSKIRRAARILTDSDFSRGEFLSRASYPEEKITTVYLGIDKRFFIPVTERQKSDFRKKYGLEGKTVVLMAGRVDPHKNIEGSIRVLGKWMKDSGRDVHLVKMGSDLTPEQKYLCMTAGLKGRQNSLLNLPAEDLPLVYQSSDALLFLSWYEGFGLPALEAMASGVPVIASNRGSLPEICGGAAWIADPMNPEESVAALEQAFSDLKLRAERIDKGKKRAAQFTWEDMAARTYAIYTEVHRGMKK